MKPGEDLFFTKDITFHNGYVIPVVLVVSEPQNFEVSVQAGQVSDCHKVDAKVLGAVFAVPVEPAGLVFLNVCLSCLIV